MSAEIAIETLLDTSDKRHSVIRALAARAMDKAAAASDRLAALQLLSVVCSSVVDDASVEGWVCDAFCAVWSDCRALRDEIQTRLIEISARWMATPTPAISRSAARRLYLMVYRTYTVGAPTRRVTGAGASLLQLRDLLAEHAPIQGEGGVLDATYLTAYAYYCHEYSAARLAVI